MPEACAEIIRAPTRSVTAQKTELSIKLLPRPRIEDINGPSSCLGQNALGTIATHRAR